MTEPLAFLVDLPEGLTDDQVDDFCAHINCAIDDALETWEAAKGDEDQ